MSQRDGYEHGVPSWIAGAHPDPEQVAAFYTELFGWSSDSRGEHVVCTLRGDDVAGFVCGEERRLAHERLGRERRRDRRSAPPRPAAASLTAAFDLAGVGRTAVIADPAGAVFTVSRARPAPRRPGGQRAGRVGDERAVDARPRQRQGLLRRRLRLGDRSLRRRRHAAAAARLPGRRARQPVPADVVAVAMPGDQPPRWDVDLWVDDPDAIAEKADLAWRPRAR